MRRTRRIPNVAQLVKAARTIAVPVPTEHQIQAAFVTWTRHAVHRHPWLGLGFAVPNGGHRSKAVAGKLKAEGVLPGVPDWLLPVPAGPYCGLAIEFKRPGEGALSREQKELLPLFRAAGFDVHVCTDAAVAATVALAYLALPGLPPFPVLPR